jgi:hypothetical protein
MLHLFGVRLHPAIGIVGGLAFVGLALAYAMPMLGLAGGVILFATATRWFGPRDPQPRGPLGEARGG